MLAVGCWSCLITINYGGSQKCYTLLLTHTFGHSNIIKYCNRPFASVKEMNDALIDNINARVGENDTLYHLGDWSFGPKYDDTYMEYVADYRHSIKCKNIILIYGNHDRPRLDFDYRGIFSEVHHLLEIKGERDHPPITLCHYAMRVWNRSHHGAWHLYGHSHNTLPDDPNAKSFDCGVDCNNYEPFSIEDVARIMAKKSYAPVDHHKETA